MIPARHHAHEARRLASLVRLGILDTLPEERFDRLARLASTILGTPISLISLVDAERQWFKARVGIDGVETAREIAFCAHAINQDDVFVVEDASLDERFADNPFVTGDPHVRFYAGAVIHAPDGMPVGTVCAIDSQPRHLDATQRAALLDIAALVDDELARGSVAQALHDLEQSERGRAMVFDSLSEGLVVQDVTGRIIDWNPAAERLLGMSAGELGGLTSLDPRWRAVSYDGSPMTGDQHPATVTRLTGEPVVDEIMGVHRGDGTVAWLKVNSTPIHDGAGTLQGVLATFGDVTEALRARRLVNATLDTAPVGLAMLDDAYRIARCNDRFALQLGRPVDELMGQDARTLLGTDLTLGDEREVRIIRPDGTEIWVCNQIADLDDPAGRMAVVSSHDVTEQRRLTNELAHRAAHDQLTDLPNRRALEQRLGEALARGRRDHRLVGLCFMDLDGFKRVNDTLGHAAGDQLLVDVADTLRAALRGGDTPARLGGDEFVAVLDPVNHLNDALIAVRRVREAIVALADRLPDGCEFGASFGLVVSEPDDTPAGMLHRADLALYRAKALGGSAIEVGVSAFA